MNRVVAFGLLVIILVGGGLEVISYSQCSVALKGVRFVKLTPNTGNPIQVIGSLAQFIANPTSVSNIGGVVLSLVQSITLNLQLNFVNNGLLPVYVPSESHQVFIDGLLVATGTTPAFWAYSGSPVSVNVTETIPATSLQPLVSTITSSGGQISVVVVGSASVLISQVPFSAERQVDLVSYIASQLKV